MLEAPNGKRKLKAYKNNAECVRHIPRREKSQNFEFHSLGGCCRRTATIRISYTFCFFRLNIFFFALDQFCEIVIEAFVFLFFWLCAEEKG